MQRRRLSSDGPDVSASDRLAIDPADRARGWRIHGLAFLATADGGRSWSELPGPDPTGVPAYAALADRDGVRVVGTDGGIYISHDRARTWDHLDNAATGQFQLNTSLVKTDGGTGDALGAALPGDDDVGRKELGCCDGGFLAFDYEDRVVRAPGQEV